MKNAARHFLHFILSKLYKLTPLGKQNKKNHWLHMNDGAQIFGKSVRYYIVINC